MPGAHVVFTGARDAGCEKTMTAFARQVQPIRIETTLRVVSILMGWASCSGRGGRHLITDTDILEMGLALYRELSNQTRISPTRARIVEIRRGSSHR